MLCYLNYLKILVAWTIRRLMGWTGSRISKKMFIQGGLPGKTISRKKVKKKHSCRRDTLWLAYKLYPPERHLGSQFISQLSWSLWKRIFFPFKTDTLWFYAAIASWIPIAIAKLKALMDNDSLNVRKIKHILTTTRYHNVNSLLRMHQSVIWYR